MIDLHLHTTASDGRSSPEDLVRASLAARLHTIAVTDHDTVAALDRAAAACDAAGIAWVPGIEITAIRDEVDVHILGYFIDHRAPRLTDFLDEQIADRRRRVREMIDRLAEIGISIDARAVLDGHRGVDPRWVGRPMLARALVRAGHVRTPREAFDLYLGEGGAAWVARRAPSPADVVSLIHDLGGLASLAHPGLVGHDEWIAPMAADGLDALEVFYSDHSPEMTAGYLGVASGLGLGITGGSDYHGDPTHGPDRPGAVTLPEEMFTDLKKRLPAAPAPGPASSSTRTAQ